MPLSEHEQRLLEQIEQALYAEDPKFASAVRSTDLRRHYRRRLLRASVLFVVGAGMLAAGYLRNVFPLKAAGAAVVLGSLVLVVAFTRHMLVLRRRLRPRPRGPHRSVIARLEDRFSRRWEQRGTR